MLQRLSRADQLCAGGALLTALSSFLSWFHWTAGGTDISVSGFRAGVLGDLVYVASAAMLLLVLVRYGIVRLGMTLPFRHEQARTILAGTVLAAAVVQALLGSGGSHGYSLGIAVAIAGGAIMLAGSLLRPGESALES